MTSKTPFPNPEDFKNVNFFGEDFPEIFKTMFGGSPEPEAQTEEDQQKEEQLKKLKSIFGSDFYEIQERYDEKHQKKD